jgi:addiction module RelE/StbE family toxin
MILVIWTPRALDDIEDIAAHVAERDLAAALRLTDLIVDGVEERLPTNPNLGRPGRVPGTRELVLHRNYIAAYEVMEAGIYVLAVYHAARDWPDGF